MLDRPIVLCLCIYILGVVLGYQRMNLGFLSLIIIGCTIGVTILHRTYKRKWVFLLPLICFFGFVLMSYRSDGNGEVRIDFSDKMQVMLIGTVLNYDQLEDRTYVTLQVERIENETVYETSVVIQSTIESRAPLQIGDIIRGEGTLYQLQVPTNDGGWNEKLYYEIRGVKYRAYLKDYEIIHPAKKSWRQHLKDFRENLKANIYQLLPSQEAGIVTAMILGDRLGLEEEIKETYQTAGIIHILAISGLHISLLGLGLFWVLKKIGCTLRSAAILTLVFLIIYCVLTGGSISTQRAVLMMGILLGAYLVGRTYDIYAALSTAAFVLLCYQPMYLLDVGFQLSFGAVLGIALLTPRIEAVFHCQYPIIKLIATSLAAFLSTFPILAFHFYEVSIYSIVANLMVIPLLTLLVPLALGSTLVSLISLKIAKVFIGTVYYILKFYEAIGTLIERLPMNTWVTGYLPLVVCVVFYSLIYLGLTVKAYPWIKGLFIMSVFALYLVVKKLPTDTLTFTFLDVAQGDAIYIEAPNRKNILIDGGGSWYEAIGEERIYPFLKYHGRTKIDYMFMTHSDSDHALGLLELLDLVKVKYLFVPQTEDKDELFVALIEKAQEQKVEIIEMTAGDRLSVGEIRVECIHPTKALKVSKANDLSLVLKVEYKDFDSLLTGDIEQETYLLDNLQPVEVLKVPHHGSKTSSSIDLLELTQPVVGIVSAGRNNLYGHPHQEIVDRYDSYGTIIYNTAQHGAITVQTDGERYTIKTKLGKD